MSYKNSIVCIFITFFLSSLCQAEESSKSFAYQGFSGGMFLHTGYVKGKSFPVSSGGVLFPTQRVEGVPLGIGGKLTLLFGHHWRFGIEGYASGVRYGANRSSFKIGWGGLLIEYTYPIKRFIPFISLTFGGGGAKNMILLEKTQHNFEPLSAVYREYGLPIINPALGCEYLLTKKLKLSLKVDYMYSPTKEPDFATGLRIYMGVLFNTMR